MRQEDKIDSQKITNAVKTISLVGPEFFPSAYYSLPTGAESVRELWCKVPLEETRDALDVLIPCFQVWVNGECAEQRATPLLSNFALSLVGKIENAKYRDAQEDTHDTKSLAGGIPRDLVDLSQRIAAGSLSRTDELPEWHERENSVDCFYHLSYSEGHELEIGTSILRDVLSVSLRLGQVGHQLREYNESAEGYRKTCWERCVSAVRARSIQLAALTGLAARSRVELNSVIDLTLNLKGRLEEFRTR